MKKEEIVRMFQAINRNVCCPSCGAKYSFDNIKIVNSEDSFCFVSLRCNGHPPILASVAIRQDNLSDPVTKTAITSDDVIKFYVKLQKIKSIKELISRRESRR